MDVIGQRMIGTKEIEERCSFVRVLLQPTANCTPPFFQRQIEPSALSLGMVKDGPIVLACLVWFDFTIHSFCLRRYSYRVSHIITTAPQNAH
jgi:hypothetical protein